MSSSVGQVIILLVNTLGGLIVLALLLRFLLQASRADFYNPVTQSLVRMTSPILNPARRIIPSWRNFDIASLLLTLVISTLATTLMIFSAGFVIPDIGTLLSWSFLGMLSLILKIYFWGLLISIIASWVAPHSGNPALMLVQQMLEPLQSLFRKVIPPMGGLDFSPIFIFLSIQVVEIMVLGTLRQGLRLSAQAAMYVIGI
ncbi:YggT family protein [Gammaproteobacteria bacterium]|nr:YggT family protein [Gammaproteobacteria bacterium]